MYLIRIWFDVTFMMDTENHAFGLGIEVVIQQL